MPARNGRYRQEKRHTMNKIKISVESLCLEAELKDTPTAKKILEILPIEGRANVWGEEIYFDIPLEMELETDAGKEVEVGDLGYWPAGPAFCIFFGPTPVSTDNRPRAFSPVNIFGHVIDDAKQFKTVSSGAKVRITAADG